MGSEDFGVFARAVPGCFTFIGNGTDPDGGGTPLHSHGYDVNDDVLDVGVAFYTALVRDVLAPGGAA
jgi:hippurate hydrolase